MEIGFILIAAIFCVLILYAGASVLYTSVLALSYFLTKETVTHATARTNTFALIVPAHNEELLIENTCKNLIQVDYPVASREIFIIADNCTDKTVDACAALPVNVLSRFDKKNAGKGHALQWAFEQVDLSRFDAVVVLDADTTVEPAMLRELNALLNQGSQAIQCFIKVPNRAESWFTQLIYVSRTINNLFYHYAKYKLGLSSYLMGSGMCFTTRLLKEQPWNAFSLSEDWEYFAGLIEKDKKVDFAVRAVVLQQESRSLKQATTQRLRWSKGRFHVVRDIGLHLLLKGVKTKNWVMADASLALLFPNWSLQINMILAIIFLSLLLPSSLFTTICLLLGVGMLAAQGFILLAGMYLAGDYWQVFKAVLVAPLFLIWKFVIDFLSFTGLYRGKKWIRTARHVPND